MVPHDWEHPKEYNVYRGEEVYKPLYDADWRERAAEWDVEREKWENQRLEPDDIPYDQLEGRRPYSGDYMPSWPEEFRTHYMMYETTTEGTPISPAFATPEELARWLADTGASAFGSMTADYDHWLRVANGGYAPSAVMQGGVMQSGVQGIDA